MWSNLPLLIIAIMWWRCGFPIQSLALASSAYLSILYHGSAEEEFAEADQVAAVAAFISSTWQLLSMLGKMVGTAAFYVCGALAFDVGVAFYCYMTATRLWGLRHSHEAARYSSWHTAWHLGIVVGQGILLVGCGMCQE